MHFGPFLRRLREQAELSQAELAARCGTTQSALAAVERGRRRPTTEFVERVLAGMGWQLKVDVEPLHADLDARIAAVEKVPLPERFASFDVDVETLVELLSTARVVYVVEGVVAAAAHGAPVRPQRMDVAVRDDDRELARLAEASRFRLLGWNPRYDEWSNGITLTVERLRETGRSQWFSPVGGELHIRLVAEPPPHVVVHVGELTLPVVGLADLEFDEPELRCVLQRLRERRRSA
jgi:transcriptional regulator with XRE-family HTH domain